MLGNTMIRETLPRVLDSVRAALPQSWRVEMTDDEARSVMRVMSASGEQADFTVEPRSLSAITGLNAMNAAEKACGQSGLVVFSPYLSGPFRAELDRSGISFADATGWVRLVSDSPMIAIAATGADHAPNTVARRQTLSLKGASAGRIVQALLTLDPPTGVRDLAETAAVSPGTVSKTLPLLTAEDAITRDTTGKITAVNRRQVLSRWTLDYRVLTSNLDVRYYVAPRGIEKAQATLAACQNVAFTGPQAARAYLPASTALLVPPTQIICYTSDPGATAAGAGLQEVDAPSANVILIAPRDRTLLDTPTRVDNTSVVPLPLALADLLTLPGRYPQQADAMMDALAKTNPAWRP